MQAHRLLDVCHVAWPVATPGVHSWLRSHVCSLASCLTLPPLPPPPPQVRFQDLEVPTDAQVVLATLQDEQQQAAQVVVPPSTLEKDLAAAGLAAPSGSIGRTSMDSSGTAADEPAGGWHVLDNADGPCMCSLDASGLLCTACVSAQCSLDCAARWQYPQQVRSNWCGVAHVNM